MIGTMRVCLHWWDNKEIFFRRVNSECGLNDRGLRNYCVWPTPWLPQCLGGAPSTPVYTMFHTPFSVVLIVLSRLNHCCWEPGFKEPQPSYCHETTEASPQRLWAVGIQTAPGRCLPRFVALARLAKRPTSFLFPWST